jgi:quercetin dioxygenase-like cupin family protein
MDPFMLEFPVKGDSREIMTPNTPGQEFCYLLEGSLRVELGEHKYELNQGDSFYFISNQAHLFTNTSNGKARMIWVVHQES